MSADLADPMMISQRTVPVYAEKKRDRHPGLLVSFESDTQAFFLNGDRIYVVAIWRPAGAHDSLRLVEAFAGNLCLGTPAYPCEAPAATNPPPS